MQFLITAVGLIRQLFLYILQLLQTVELRNRTTVAGTRLELHASANLKLR